MDPASLQLELLDARQELPKRWRCMAGQRVPAQAERAERERRKLGRQRANQPVVREVKAHEVVERRDRLRRLSRL